MTRETQRGRTCCPGNNGRAGGGGVLWWRFCWLDCCCHGSSTSGFLYADKVVRKQSPLSVTSTFTPSIISLREGGREVGREVGGEGREGRREGGREGGREGEGRQVRWRMVDVDKNVKCLN